MEKEFDYQGIGRAFNAAFASGDVVIFAVVPRRYAVQKYGDKDTYSCAVFAAARKLPVIDGAIYGTRSDGTQYMLHGSLTIIACSELQPVGKKDIFVRYDYNGNPACHYFVPSIAKQIANQMMPDTFKAEWPGDEELLLAAAEDARKAEKSRVAEEAARAIRDGYRANLHAGKPETPESIALYEASANFDFTFEYSDDNRYCINTRREMHSLVERMRDAGLNAKAFTDRILGYSE